MIQDPLARSDAVRGLGTSRPTPVRRTDPAALRPRGCPDSVHFGGPLRSVHVVVALVVATLSAGVVYSDDDDLSAWLAPLPAASATAADEHYAKWISHGAPIERLVARLEEEDAASPPRELRTKLELALSGLVSHAARPGAEEERVAIERSLIQALGETRAIETRAFVVSLLGRIGREPSVEALEGLLGDSALAGAATRAIAATRSPRAGAVLRSALAATSGRDRIGVIQALARLGAREAEGAILALTGDADVDTRGAAWCALAELGSDRFAEGVDVVLGSVERPGTPIAPASVILYAERLSRRGRGADAAVLCRRFLDGAALGHPNDPEAPTDPTPRIASHLLCAALTTLVEAEGSDAAPEILRHGTSKDPELRAVALRLAMTVDAKGDIREGETARSAMTRAWLDRLAAIDAVSPPDARAEIIEMLGGRGDATALPMLRAIIADENADLRVAALRAMARIEKRNVGTVILDAARDAKGASRALLLEDAARLGGASALELLTGELSSTDSASRNAAARALTSVNDVNALGPLMVALGAVEDEELRLRIVRSYLGIIRGARFPRPRVLTHYEDALALAKSPAERRLLVDAFGRLRIRASLEILSGMIDDSALGEEASRALIEAALPRRDGNGGLRGRGVADMIGKASTRLGDDPLAARGREYAATLPPADPANLAEHRPVRASVEHQGEYWPDLAVDGDAISPDSAWFGSSWPAWLEVDLEETTAVAAAHVHFWHFDTRFYQYAIEVSKDREEWITVVDHRDNVEPARPEGKSHEFPEIEARWVRIHVTKNSVNEAVHLLEFSVYGPDASQ
jgi:HEAT repeat protein